MDGFTMKITIHSNQFMIIGLDKFSHIFYVQNHIIYDTYASALHSAQDLARSNAKMKYIVVAVAAIAQAVENPVVTTTYKL